MKKLLIIIGCLTAIILTSSCTADSVDENETTTINDDIHPTTVDHGGNDKDKDKVKT